MKYFCFDVETGGLELKYSLLTLYGIVLDAEFNIHDEIELAIKPNDGNYQISANALGINKINLLEHDKSAISLKEASNRFTAFICRHSIHNKLIPVGQNISFDIDFTKHYLMKNGEWEKSFSHRKIDLQSIALFLNFTGLLSDLETYSLENLAKHFNIDTQGLHNAKRDVLVTREIILKLSNQLRRINAL